MAHVIPVLSLGSYYTKHCPTPGPYASEMRNLVYAVKGKWWPGGGGSLLPGHPWRRDSRISIANSEQASWYAAESLTNARQILALDPRMFGRCVLIPIPSSVVTVNKPNERWGAAQFADALALYGWGTVVRAVTNKADIGSASEGNRHSAKVLLGNFLQVQGLNDTRYVVYVDDTLTYGAHIAAMHALLGSPPTARAIVVGMTTKDGTDAYKLRRRDLTVHSLDNITEQDMWREP